jgi:hypothetical protein
MTDCSAGISQESVLVVTGNGRNCVSDGTRDFLDEREAMGFMLMSTLFFIFKITRACHMSSYDLRDL